MEEDIVVIIAVTIAAPLCAELDPTLMPAVV